VVYQPTETSPHFAGPYVVEQLLPPTDTGPVYKIKSVRDGHERIAAERELTLATVSEASRTVRQPKGGGLKEGPARR
jgi:hypothetical protein